MPWTRTPEHPGCHSTQDAERASPNTCSNRLGTHGRIFSYRSSATSGSQHRSIFRISFQHTVVPETASWERLAISQLSCGSVLLLQHTLGQFRNAPCRELIRYRPVLLHATFKAIYYLVM